MESMTADCRGGESILLIRAGYANILFPEGTPSIRFFYPDKHGLSSVHGIESFSETGAVC